MCSRTNPLLRINGTLKQDQDKCILESTLVQFSPQYYESLSHFTYQHDNCSPYKAKSIKHDLDLKGISVIVWPTRSSDLNPIENT